MGGNVPLIGVATWGAISNRGVLSVPSGRVNPGYITKAPVQYQLAGTSSELESNHTHFVLVDDGSEGVFGREIDLRGGFEAAARAPRGSALERVVLTALRRPRASGQLLGWEGCSEVADADSAGRGPEAGRAVCLCFEGGPNTLGTVAASARNGTPVLVFRGTGRAADLLADCLHIHGLSLQRGRADDPDAAVIMDADGLDTIQLRRLVLICRLLPLAKDWRAISTNRASANSSNSWPPTVAGAELGSVFSKESLATPWAWRRRRGRWVHRDDPAQALEPGSEQHLILTLRVGFLLFGEYHLGFNERAAVGDVMRAVCNLYDSCASGLCAVHRLGQAPRGGAEGGVVQGRLQESMAKCIIGGLKEEELLAKKRTVFGWWVESTKRGEDAVKGQTGGIFRVQDAARLQRMLCRVQAAMLRIERSALLDVMALLIEWGLTSLAMEVLQGAGDFLAHDVLNVLLHMAILHNRWAIVSHLLDLGAAPDMYEDNLSTRTSTHIPDRHKLDPLPPRSAWKELLEHETAFGDGHDDRSLISLMVSVGALQLNGHRQVEIKDDTDALKALDKFYQYLTGTYEEHCTSSFMFRQDGSRLEADYNLFMCMLVMNRPEMARVFFVRLSGKVTALLLPYSLIACMVCRNLGARVGARSHHLTNDLENTAIKYEEFASNVLRTAYTHNEKGAIVALEKPLKQYSKWTSLDLVMKAECRIVVENSPEMCVSAVNQRFTGGGDVADAIARLNQGLMKTFNPSPKSSGLFFGSNLGSIAPWKKLVLCLAIDMIRIFHYLFDIFPSALMMLWAPISAVLNYNLFGNLFLSGFAVVEEFLPMLDILPTATLAWFYLGQESHKELDADEFQERPYVPMDDFILEVLVHCLNSYIMTVFILMAPSPLTFALEVFVLMLLIGDVVADIVFAGIEDENTRLWDGLKKGCEELYGDPGY